MIYLLLQSTRGAGDWLSPTWFAGGIAWIAITALAVFALATGGLALELRWMTRCRRSRNSAVRVSTAAVIRELDRVRDKYTQWRYRIISFPAGIRGVALSQVVEFPLDGAEVVLVEVADEEGVGLERVGRPVVAAREASETLQDALRRTTPAVQAVLTRMRELTDPPDKVTVRFGIKLTAAAGVVIAQASSEANFEVSVEWTRQTPPGSWTTDATQGDE